MTIEQKQVKAKTVLKEVVAESAEKLEQVSKEAQQKVATYGYAFGLIGSFIAANNQIKNRSCYILTSDSSTVYRVNSKYMAAFLRNSPQLRKEYTKIDKKEKESPEVVLEYFNKLQLLSNY